ncbi:MAG: hypothetical protein US76_03900 [Parcubacteria group bacterium GW2011_GWA2_38_13b]|nr:MAG: hypothetical protein US76_03900 [Parcubacteria group bacterium GW2011_GWA2_38_13b]
MKEIILPKSNSETGGKPKEDWEKIVIPESMSQTEELKLYPEILNKFGEKIKDTEADLVKVNEKIELYNEKIVDQSNKNIETIGVFSAILALLIIDVSIVKSATSFLSAILLIVSLATVLSIFAILIHILFVPSDKQRLSAKILWFPIIVLILFIILGILSEIFKWPWSYWIK